MQSRELTHAEQLERARAKLETFGSQGWSYVVEEVEELLDSFISHLQTDLSNEDTIKVRTLILQLKTMQEFKRLTEEEVDRLENPALDPADYGEDY